MGSVHWNHYIRREVQQFFIITIALDSKCYKPSKIKYVDSCMNLLVCKKINLTGLGVEPSLYIKFVGGWV